MGKSETSTRATSSVAAGSRPGRKVLKSQEDHTRSAGPKAIKRPRVADVPAPKRKKVSEGDNDSRVSVSVEPCKRMRAKTTPMHLD